MKVLIIPDSFKGSLKATEVALEMKKAVTDIFPNAICNLMPFSDGGEGALNVLENHADGKIIHCAATDSLKRNLIAPLFLFKNTQSAWIELSQTAGLVQLKKEERNPLKTSTWGTGMMIRHAINQGCKTIYLGIGGSATHDVGTGIISALGGKFYDINNTSLEPNGAQLNEIDRIDLSGLDSRVREIKWVIACDVKNNLTGPYGAANTYAKQKGASPEVIVTLEKGSKQFAKIIKKQFNRNILDISGGGAAGGVSAGLFGVFDATLQNGFELLSQQTKINEQIKQMDLVLTGEGHFDEQSTYGKLALQVAKLTLQYKIKTLVFAGKTSLSSLPNLPHLEIHQTTPHKMPLDQAMKNAAQNLRSKLLEILGTYKNQIQ
jgi:glycerate 2-kinase